MTIFLIRHGEIDNPQKVFYGRTIDLSLNDIGRKQIKDASGKIKDAGFKIEKIYTSPLARTRQSAEIIAVTFKLSLEDIIMENDLTEVDIPALVGQSISLQNIIYAREIDDYSEEFIKQGNESKEQVIERMLGVFKKVVLENLGKTIAMVGHGDPIRLLLFALENPKKKIPYMYELKKYDYPEKGEAVKIVLDENGKFVSKEFI